MPAFFAGTNCRASGVFVAPPAPHGAPPNYVVWMRLRVGGETVKEYFHIQGEPERLTPAGISCVFDSTHFAYHEQVWVSLEARDAFFNFLSASDFAYTKNRSLAYGIRAGWSSNGQDRVEDAFTQTALVNAYDFHKRDDAWLMQDYISDQGESNCLYVNVHGGIGYHNSSNSLESINMEPIGGPTDSYPNVRATINGGGFPPFNSTGAPPVNYINIDACETGNTTHPHGPLYPWINAYTMALENQAVHAYLPKIPITQTELRASLVYQRLVEGHTVLVSALSLLQEAQANGLYVINPNETHRPIDFDDIVIAGDSTTRITSVYTGNHLPPQGWYL